MKVITTEDADCNTDPVKISLESSDSDGHDFGTHKRSNKTGHKLESEMMSEHSSEGDEYSIGQHNLSKKFSEPSSPTEIGPKNPSVSGNSPQLRSKGKLGSGVV